MLLVVHGHMQACVHVGGVGVKIRIYYSRASRNGFQYRWV